VSLNVKDPEAHRLAEAISKETGESLTKVVINSLRERWERMEKQRQRPRVSEILAAAASVRETLTGPLPDHGELLYGEDGLPK
jgi:antitoxin VapB